MPKPLTLHGKVVDMPEFEPREFLHVETADRIFRGLVEFIDSGFKDRKFTSFLYKHLMHMFGHIAHYNAIGFYDEWFRNGARDWRRWVEHALDAPTYPHTTYYQVENAVKITLMEHSVLAKLRVLANRAGEESELLQLAALIKKYPEQAKELLRG